MESSVILSSPALLIIVLLGLGLVIFEKRTRATGFVLPLVSVLLCLLTVFLTFLYGGSWYEVIVLVLLFLAAFLYERREDK